MDRRKIKYFSFNVTFTPEAILIRTGLLSHAKQKGICPRHTGK